MEVTATKAMQLLSCVSCLKRALFHDGPTQKNVMQFVIKYNEYHKNMHDNGCICTPQTHRFVYQIFKYI